MHNHGGMRTGLVLLAIVLWFGLGYRYWPLPAAGEAGCERAVTGIQRIQGSGAVTPLDGKTVLTEGVVTADFTSRGHLGGFFIQQRSEEATDRDTASRGLFVYAPEADVTTGEAIRVRGEAGEYHGMTQLSDARIETRCGQPGRPAATEMALPASETRRERLEGMRVRLAGDATITGLYELGRYGVVTLADERLYQPTQVAAPGDSAADVAERNENRRLRLDDGSRRQFGPLPEWVVEHYETDGSLRVGDRLTDVTGVLDYRYDAWRLQPTTAPGVKTLNPRPSALERPEPGTIRVAGLNLQNYFNGDGEGNGFPTDRGAESARAWQRQHQRLTTALEGMAADIVGLVELENDGTGPRSAIASLVGDLAGDWDYARPERRPGDDAIAVGLAWRRGRVEPIGDPEVLRQAPFNQGSRPPVAQRFRHTDSGAVFLVVVNHFKSKRCGDASGEEAASGNGEGCWSRHRERATRQLLAWVDELTASMEQRNVLLVGDLNAYARERPLSILSRAGYSNVLDDRHPAPASSYIYRAQSGTLDYILSSDTFRNAVTAAGIWPINADEPAMLHFSRDDHDGLPEAVSVSGRRPWRASDHDPTWVDLEPE